MNNEREQKLFESLKVQRMSSVERAQIRSVLQEHVAGNVPTYHMFRFLHLRQTVLVASLVLFVSFGTVAVSAEKSLPGSLLYSLKTHINEPIRAAVAMTPEARINVEAELIDRRIAELEALSLSNRLDTVVEAKLTNEAASRAERFAEKINLLEEKIDSEYAVSVTSRVEVSLGRREALGTMPSATSLSMTSFAEPALAERVSDSDDSSESDSGAQMMMVVSSEDSDAKADVDADEEWNAYEEKSSGKREEERLSSFSKTNASDDELSSARERLSESARRITEIRSRIEERAREKSERSEESRKGERN